MEQGNIAAMIPQNLLTIPATGGQWWGGAWTAANNKVKSFNCPADLPDTISSTTGCWAYLYESGYTLYGGYFGPTPSLGKTSYVANAGALGNVGSPAEGGDTFYGQWVGPYYNNSQTKIVTISDGTSNTLSFGETLGGTWAPSRDFLETWMGAGSLPTAWGVPNNCQGGTNGPQWYTYGSMHDAVVNFAMCDGSVKGIRKGVGNSCASGTTWFTSDWYVFMYASGMRDGATYDPSVIGQ
jgi:prepilin-type processing-associated H-X9-DG protein